MKIKNKYGWTLNITDGSEKLTQSELEELKRKDIEYYFSDADGTYWFFMFKIGNKWVEQSRPIIGSDINKQEFPIIIS